MARWEPAADERLQKAALELFASRGFDETTVADVAAAAGLTERTFYRYFADKREVLFPGHDFFQNTFLAALDTAPKDARPFDQVMTAVASVCGTFGPFTEERRPWSRLRQVVIVAHPELLERELLKMSALAGALAGALRARGVTDPTASLAAESAVMVFRVAFEQWVAPSATRTLVDIQGDVLREMRALAA